MEGVISYDIVIIFGFNKVSGVGLVEFFWICVGYGDEYFGVGWEFGGYREVVVNGGYMRGIYRE